MPEVIEEEAAEMKAVKGKLQEMDQTKNASIAAETKPPQQPPIEQYKFPPLDNIGSHFYDNEAGTFWVGLNLRGDPLAMPLILDAAKLPMVQAMFDFRAREQKRSSIITRVKESVGGMKESLDKMMGRVGKSSVLSS